MIIGRKIGVGNTAEIYELDDNKVLKLFFSRYHENSVQEEFSKAKVFLMI